MSLVQQRPIDGTMVLKGLSFTSKGVKAHLQKWINDFNKRINESICFIDCTLSDFEHNLSFSLELSPWEDESAQYVRDIEKYLTSGFTVGGHYLFKMGLPIYPTQVDNKREFEQLPDKTGYDISFLVEEIQSSSNIHQKSPQGIVVQRGTKSEVLAQISPADTLSLRLAFDKFVAECCVNRHDENGRGVKFIFGIPICRLPLKTNPAENDMCACVFLGFSNAVSQIDAWKYADEVRRFFNETVLPVFSELKTAAEQTKSAIGSIMSRNGSHNIGSHVLSALSHNVGTMPDDRVLYQYIQHRMDYIATATTEFPQWTTPTMFVGGLMKNFYAQKHLLDYISRSEGLRAYKFQERNLDDAARMNQHGTIRIFLRRFYKLNDPNQGELPHEHRYLTYDQHGHAWSIYYFFGEKDKMFRQKFSENKRTQYEVSESGGTAKFLEYDERFTPDWKQDVRIAIPGGIVGQHAFYTIIENVIRNAAKHGWASEKNLMEKDLEVYVDFGEENSSGEVVFTIGDNVSNIFGNAKDFWEKFFAWHARAGKKDEEFLKEWEGALDLFAEEIKSISTLRELDGGAIIKEAYGALKVWSRFIKCQKVGDIAKAEVTRETAEEFNNLLVRAFTAPLSNDDAGRLEQYLRESNKDSSADIKIPLIYAIQKTFLEEEDGNKKRWIAPEWSDYLTTNAPSKNSNTCLGRRLVLPLHHAQHSKLAQSFIDENGVLRKANWGLAEMKISAGYLAQRDASEIGGLDAKGNNIIVPVAMPGLCRNADNPHNCLACSPLSAGRMRCYGIGCPVYGHLFHLGYRFRLVKPKDMLVILKIANGELADQDIDRLKSVASHFQGMGLHFAYAKISTSKTESPAGLDCYFIGGPASGSRIEKFNYRYVVVPEFSEEQGKVVGQKNKKRTSVNKNPEVVKKSKSLLSQFGFRCVHLDEVQLCGENTYNLGDIVRGLKPVEKVFIGKADDNARAVVLRKAVFSAWIKRLATECRKIKDHSVKLVVNVDGNEGGRERGLVTRKDLLRTMFVECYHTALISFLKNPPGSLALSDTSRNLIALLSLIKVIPDAMVEPQQDYGHGDDKGAKEYIRAQLVWYCDLLKSHLMLSSEFIDALKSIELYVKDGAGTGDAVVTRKMEDISKDFEKAIARRLFRGKQDEDDDIKRWCKELIAFLRKVDKKELDGWLDAFHGGSDRHNCPQGKDSYGHGRHSFEDNLKAIITACSVPEEDEFNALVESLNSMFLASDVYLRKYEERIATLPEAYKHDGANRETTGEDSAKVESVQAIADTLLGQSLVDESNCRVIKYSRHDHSMPANGIYSEALSGSQSYLNALSRLVYASGEDKTGERYASVARLLENAFLRILIIDERVMNFVEERRSDEMKKTFIDMGIWVADVVNEGVSKVSSEVKDELYRFKHYKDVVKSTNDSYSQYIDIDPGQFDILVIHQGIIDKWWERHDESKVKEILEDLRLSIPRVVVTTGRGRPENIPADEKVLPFSVIESSLFKRYPEKLIFVNTIMNLLPYGTDKTKVS